MIYFLSCAEASLIKIGHTKGDAAYRLQQILRSSPFDLEIIGAMRGDREMETELHKRFSHLHVRREWFRDNGEILAMIADAGGMETYDRLARNSLRKPIFGEAKKAWPSEIKEKFRVEFGGRDIVLFREGTRDITDDDEAEIRRFLRENNLESAA